MKIIKRFGGLLTAAAILTACATADVGEDADNDGVLEEEGAEPASTSQALCRWNRVGLWDSWCNDKDWLRQRANEVCRGRVTNLTFHGCAMLAGRASHATFYCCS